jgi:hypothetical protein
MLLEVGMHLPKEVAPQVPNSAQSSNKTVNNMNPPLPRIRIPNFDGTVTQYSKFIQAFKSQFDRPSLNAAEKLLYLQSSVTGTASQLIKNLPYTDAGYAKAVEIFESKYNREGQVIRSLYQHLYAIPKATEDLQSLRNTYTAIDNLLSALEVQGENLTNNVNLKDIVFSKIPQEILFQLTIAGQLTLGNFRTRLDELLTLREDIVVIPATFHCTPPSPKQAATYTLLAAPALSTKTKQPRSPQYIFCGLNNHYSNKCTKYLTVETRKQQITGHCFNCFAKSHTIEKCGSQKLCFHCKKIRAHHSSLCPDEYTTPKIAQEIEKITQTLDTSCITAAGLQNSMRMFVHTGVHLTAVTSVQNPNTKFQMPLRIIFYSGCPESLITTEAVQKLGLDTFDKQVISVKGFLDASPKKIQTATANVHLPTINQTISVQTTPEIATGIRSIEHKSFLQQYPQYQSLTFAEEGNNTDPHILIRGDYFFSLLTNEPKIPISDRLHLVQTVFGWLVAGTTTSVCQPISKTLLLTTVEALEKLCDLDVVGIRNSDISSAQEEQTALYQFYNTIEYKDNRYSVGWPWRVPPDSIASNYGLALGRLKSQHQRLQYHPELLREYNLIIKQQLADGVIEPVTEDYKTTNVYYIPHKAVLQPSKNTPLCIVYDASSRAGNAQSLNQALYKGRTLLEDQIRLIIRFCRYLIALIADLEKAYHQIGLLSSN